MNAPFTPSRPRRQFRRFQFSLRTLLALATLASLLFAWWHHRIQRDKRVENAVRALETCPDLWRFEFDPAALVQTVNQLHALGKDDAIEAMRRFESRRVQRPRRLDDLGAVDLVIPLLFEPTGLDNDCPLWKRSGREDHFEWYFERPRVYLYLQDDLPFINVPGGARSIDRDKTPLIDWAEQHARLRQGRLRPCDNPLTAAEKAGRRWKFDWPYEPKGQALHCLDHLFAPRPYLGANMERLKAECRRLGICWSEEKQEYVATKRKK